jgi:hypothetical protein
MIKKIKLLFVAVGLSMTFGITSCKDFLDRDPQSLVSDKDAFKNFVNFQGFTEELYHCIPDFTNAYWTTLGTGEKMKYNLQLKLFTFV